MDKAKSNPNTENTAEPLITVITPTTGAKELADNLKSVAGQTYKNLQHLLVVDGKEHEGKVREILSKSTVSQKRDIIYLPYATGKNRWLGRKIYAASCYLAKGDYLIFLDEDNYLDPNHTESLIGTVQKNKVRWAYSLRRILDNNGTFVCNDDCESLGKWPSFTNDNDYLIDVNCYFLPKLLAVRLTPLWFNRAFDPNSLSVDRLLVHALRQLAPAFECTYKYSVNYRVGMTPPFTVPKEFFINGNQKMLQKYNGKLPWKRP